MAEYLQLSYHLSSPKTSVETAGLLKFLQNSWHPVSLEFSQDEFTQETLEELTVRDRNQSPCDYTSSLAWQA
jgi:hypothetical protein